MLICDICDKYSHTYCVKQDQFINNRNKCTKCSLGVIKKSCSNCNQSFTCLKQNDNLCNDCENKVCTNANCQVCGQYIHIIEQKKRIRNCIQCLKYVHVSCDKYYGSEKLDNYVCLYCRDKDSASSNYISPVLDKVFLD